MEQDIKRLKEKINNIKKYNTYRYDWTEIDIQTVEHLIKAYKELKEENNNLKTHIFNPKIVKLNYIPKSLVEETIEELNRKIKYEDNEKVIIWLHKQRKILQELLEKRK